MRLMLSPTSLSGLSGGLPPVSPVRDAAPPAARVAPVPQRTLNLPDGGAPDSGKTLPRGSLLDLSV